MRWVTRLPPPSAQLRINGNCSWCFRRLLSRRPEAWRRRRRRRAGLQIVVLSARRRVRRFSPHARKHTRLTKHTDSACWGPAESTGGSKRPRREWCFGKTDAKCGGLRNRGSIWPRSQSNTLLTNILEIVSASVIAVCILIYIVHLLYGQWGKVAARFRPQAADV